MRFAWGDVPGSGKVLYDDDGDPAQVFVAHCAGAACELVEGGAVNPQ